MLTLNGNQDSDEDAESREADPSTTKAVPLSFHSGVSMRLMKDEGDARFRSEMPNSKGEPLDSDER
jgi:hypothetical protein